MPTLYLSQPARGAKMNDTYSSFDLGRRGNKQTIIILIL